MGNALNIYRLSSMLCICRFKPHHMHSLIFASYINLRVEMVTCRKGGRMIRVGPRLYSKRL
uniref:Uncharacterized protein n=1 Tax=Cannabis sativa TaxID=3483 RepID=A0A803R584_CANSA